jgi:hypothetical protein
MINWNISSTYQHQSQALLKRYQQKEISLQEYESQLKQLKEQDNPGKAQSTGERMESSMFTCALCVVKSWSRFTIRRKMC